MMPTAYASLLRNAFDALSARSEGSGPTWQRKFWNQASQGHWSNKTNDKYCVFVNFNIVPSIAQLVERRTVVDKNAAILRSLVRLRLEGQFFSFSRLFLQVQSHYRSFL